jgi:hypothetical protein
MDQTRVAVSIPGDDAVPLVHRHHIEHRSVPADRPIAAVEEVSPGAGEQPDTIPLGQLQRVVPVTVRRSNLEQVRPDLADIPPLDADAFADLMGIRVRRRTDGRRLTGCLKPFQVKLRNALDHAIPATRNHLGRAIRSLHLQGFPWPAIPEQLDDLLFPFGLLPFGGQYLRHLFSAEGTTG